MQRSTAASVVCTFRLWMVRYRFPNLGASRITALVHQTSVPGSLRELEELSLQVSQSAFVRIKPVTSEVVPYAHTAKSMHPVGEKVGPARDRTVDIRVISTAL